MAQCYESRLQINCPVFSLTSHSCPPLFILTMRQEPVQGQGRSAFTSTASLLLAAPSSICLFFFSQYFSSAFLLPEFYNAYSPFLYFLCIYQFISFSTYIPFFNHFWEEQDLDACAQFTISKWRPVSYFWMLLFP